MKRTTVFLLALILILSLAAGAAASAENDYAELSAGSTGDEVRRLQARLQELGYDIYAVDGSFGPGTKEAVRCFQASNGLEPTGIASPEMQRVLFSDTAQSQMIPGAEITAFSGTYPVHYVIRNNMDVAIDRVYLNFYPLDENGNYLTEDPLSPTNAGIGVRYARSLTIQPGQDTNQWEYAAALMGDEVEEAGISIRGYHTVDGRTYEFDADQIPVLKTFGTPVAAEDRSGQIWLSAEDYSRASSVKLGYQYARVYPWLASAYQTEAGDYVMDIEKGSILQKAGIRQGDVLLTFDGDSVLDGLAAKRAKLRLLEGESVEVRYLHEGEIQTLTIQLNG